MNATAQQLYAELLLLLEREGFSPELILPETRLEQLDLTSAQLIRLKLGLEIALGHPLDEVPLNIDSLGGLIQALLRREARHQGVL